MTVATPPAAAPTTLLTAPDEAATPPVAPPATPPVAPPAAPAAGEGAPPAPPAEGTPPATGDEGKPPEGKPEEKPAKVEVKFPDGYVVDEAVKGELDAVIADAKLSGEQAQRLVDLHVRTQEAIYARGEQALAKQAEEWTAAIKADKEIGGEGHKQALAHAKSILAQHGTPELLAVLDQSGMGNHPEVVRLLARLGKATAEDTIAGAQGGGRVTPANNEEAALREMYPSMFKGS